MLNTSANKLGNRQLMESPSFIREIQVNIMLPLEQNDGADPNKLREQ